MIAYLVMGDVTSEVGSFLVLPISGSGGYCGQDQPQWLSTAMSGQAHGRPEGQL